ncbi:MAG TPA: alpha/beta family hydrolase [Chryseolinea sp.]|nr:alpha/beta family hydrolase [Chryseolinea sp.]
MKITEGKILVSKSIGSVSSILTEGSDTKFLATLAHGAGAGMKHSFMEAIANALALHSVSTLRFNFPFSEAGKNRPDPAPIAEHTIGAALSYAAEINPGVPLLASGKSFGGRMSSHYLSKNTIDGVKGIIFYGFPLHAPGQPGVNRADHLASINVPMLFLQGTKDTLARLPLIQEVCAKLPTATLATFEGADHSFKAGKRDVISELVVAAIDWLENTIKTNHSPGRR